MVNIAKQLDIIIDAESNWGILPDGTIDYGRCNLKEGCGSGQGLIQLIESTRKHCSKKLEREIDKTNPYDSIDCGNYLLEEEGIQHWEQWSGPY